MSGERARAGVESRATGTLRRWSGAAIVIALILVATAWSVRRLARTPLSIDDSARSRRVIAYEAFGPHSATWKVAPGTDVLRFVAYRPRSGGEDQSARPPLRAIVTISGHEQPMTIAIPVSRRAPNAAFEASGDPLVDSAAFDLDVRDDAPCDVTIVSAEHEELVLMAWARAIDSGDGSPAARLPTKARGAMRARGAGELDWIDLDSFEKQTLAERRWHRLAAVSSTANEDGVALVLRPPHQDIASVAASPPRLHQVIGLGQVVRANADGPIEMTLEGSSASAISVDIHSRNAPPRHLGGTLPFILSIPAGTSQQVEITAETGTTLDLRTSGAGSVNLGSTVHPFQATPTAPLVLGSIDVPRVVRVTARVAMGPAGSESAAIAVDATIEATGAPAEVAPLRGQVKRSHVDRFDAPQRDLSPSEAASFLLLVPPNATLTLRPAAAEVAITLAELDAGPAIVAFTDRPKGQTTPFARARFVPLHLDAATPPDDPASRIHLAPPLLEQTLHHLPSIGRLSRPPHAASIKHEGRTYVSSISPLEVRIDRDAIPRVVFLRLYSRTPMEVVLRVDGGSPRRRSSGITTHVTSDRRVHVDGEATAVVLLGDDLAPGAHTVEAVAPPGKEVWVHARWEKGKSRKQSFAPARWIAGDFGQ